MNAPAPIYSHLEQFDKPTQEGDLPTISPEANDQEPNLIQENIEAKPEIKGKKTVQRLIYLITASVVFVLILIATVSTFSSKGEEVSTDKDVLATLAFCLIYFLTVTFFLIGLLNFYFGYNKSKPQINFFMIIIAFFSF